LKKGGGKLKGSKYERDICRILSKWLTGKTDPVAFWRSASSGAQATQMGKTGKESNQQGDIKGATEEAIFITDRIYFECKSYANWNLDCLICDDRKGVIKEWLNKLFIEASSVIKIPWLIFKRNSSTNYICIEDSVVSRLIKNKANLQSGFIMFNFYVPEGLISLSIYRLDFFLSQVTPGILRKTLKGLTRYGKQSKS